MYMAPEMLTSKGYQLEIDIWSFAVIFFYLITGSPPFKGQSKSELQKNILNAHFEFPNHVSPQAQDLITRCFFLNPRKRPTYEQILTHEFFSMNKFPNYLSPWYRFRCPDN
jgi:serine/threonine protein kinase